MVSPMGRTELECDLRHVTREPIHIKSTLHWLLVYPFQRWFPALGHPLIPGNLGWQHSLSGPRVLNSLLKSRQRPREHPLIWRGAAGAGLYGTSVECAVGELLYQTGPVRMIGWELLVLLLTSWPFRVFIWLPCGYVSSILSRYIIFLSGLFFFFLPFLVLVQFTTKYQCS